MAIILLQEIRSQHHLMVPFNGGRIYPFNTGLRIYGEVYHPPFGTLKKCTFAYDMNLKLYR